MFDCPPTAEGKEGETDGRPIVLPEITCDQFVALMDYFYKGCERCFSYHNPISLLNNWCRTFFKNKTGASPTSLKQYKDLLSIATLYECSEARLKAIRGIESWQPTAIELIVLAERYNVGHWLKPAYVRLCKRDEPLTRNEASQIGLDKVIMIAAAREKLRFSDEKKEALVRELGPDFLEDARVGKAIDNELHSESKPVVMGKKSTGPAAFGKLRHRKEVRQ